MDIFQTTGNKADNTIIPEEISIKLEPELVLLDDDDDDEDEYDDDNTDYSQSMSICQAEYEEYDGPEVVGNTGAYMSYDEIQLQNELETSQTAGDDDDVILIESDSDGNEGNSSDMKVSYECKMCFKTVATSYNLKRHMMIHSGNWLRTTLCSNL